MASTSSSLQKKKHCEGDQKAKAVVFYRQNKNSLREAAIAMMVPFATLTAWNNEFDEKMRRIVTPENRGKASRITADMVRTIVEAAKDYLTRSRMRIGRFTRWLKEQEEIYLSAKVVAEILIANGLHEVRTRRRRPKFYQSLRQRIPNGLVSLDGSELTIWLGEEVFKFNLEMAVDVGTFTHTGYSIGDHENAEEVIKVLEMHRRDWGSPLGAVFDSGSWNLSLKVQSYLEAHKILPVPCGPANPKGNGTDEGAFSQFKAVVGEIRLDTSSPRNLARSILEVVTSIYVKMRNKLPLRGSANTPVSQMNELAGNNAINLEKQRIQTHILSKAGNEDDLRKLDLLHAMQRNLEIVAEPEALKRAEKTITGYEIEAIVAAEKAFITAINRKPERKTLPYFFGILKRIQQERDDASYAAHCRARYDYEQVQKRERAQRDLQEQNQPPKLELIIEMLVRSQTASSHKLRAFAIRKAKEWTEQLIKGKKYLENLKRKGSEVLATMNQLSAETKENVYRIFEGFFSNSTVESVT